MHGNLTILYIAHQHIGGHAHLIVQCTFFKLFVHIHVHACTLGPRCTCMVYVHHLFTSILGLYPLCKSIPRLFFLQPNLFQPAHRRIEMASEQQREMEGAFERLFVRTQGTCTQPHSVCNMLLLVIM